MSASIRISPERVRNVANAFKNESQQSQAMIQRLKQQVTQLQGEWAGMSSQRFYQEYQAWEKQMQGFTQMLDGISRELDQIATRFQQADESR